VKKASFQIEFHVFNPQGCAASAGESQRYRRERSLGARPDKGFYIASDDIKATQRLVVHAGTDAYPVSKHVDAVGLRELANKLAVWEKG
jgi:hypothetical protein